MNDDASKPLRLDDGPIEIPAEVYSKLNEGHLVRIFDAAEMRAVRNHELKVKQLGIAADREKSANGLLYRREHAVLERIVGPIVAAFTGYVAGRAKGKGDERS